MIAFIIGCARSGTTWLGRALQTNPGFRVAIEDPVLFPLVDEMALFPASIARKFPRLVEAYRQRRADAAPHLFIDKSHQNIWLAEALAEAFSDARFLAIERSPHATVASMLRHPVVLGHFYRWRMYPVPNFHLGISPDVVEGYDALPMTVKCALRWASHQRRLAQLAGTLGDQLTFIRYESLVVDPAAYRERLSCFLGRPVVIPRGDADALLRWEGILSRDQIKMVDSVITPTRRLAPAQPVTPEPARPQAGTRAGRPPCWG
jgi:hypothetical protein